MAMDKLCNTFTRTITTVSIRYEPIIKQRMIAIKALGLVANLAIPLKSKPDKFL